MTFLEPREPTQYQRPPLRLNISEKGEVQIEGDTAENIEATLQGLASADYRASLHAQLARELKPPDGRIESITFLVCVTTASIFVLSMLFQVFQSNQQCKVSYEYNQFHVSSVRHIA